ncbi:MAG TPA: glycosyltransferase family A protein [Solirubrobacteraceae bacterium]|nr:glycosyltransferase family A protein [Solirubrobacteraceae bacterium]
MALDAALGTVSAGERAAPLVTVGIPTYNRPSELGRAARSVLAQDHAPIELLISDNASTDPDVRRVGGQLAAEYPQVRFVSHERNRGHEFNFQWLLDSARGDYFMWLSDDDWLDPAYVSRCVAELRADPDTVLVCGGGRYHRDGHHVLDERPIELTDRHPAARLVRYFARVSLNGPVFGVAARDDLLPIGFPPVIGGDWMLVAALAAKGRVRTLPDVHIHRSMSGLGSDAARLADDFGLQGLLARQSHAFVAASIARQIAAGAPPYRRMGHATRLVVATAAAGLILTRFSAADAVRRLLGPARASALERRISRWLRARDARGGAI